MHSTARVVLGLSILASTAACHVVPNNGSQFADESSGSSTAGTEGEGGESGSPGETAVDAGSDGAGDDETSAGETGVAESNGGTPQVCGNDAIEGTEECDQTDFGFRTCQTYGFLAGDLTCKDDCTVDPSSCSAEAICGDLSIAGLEQCEGEDLGGASCDSLGWGTGELGCTDDCTFDAAACSCAGKGEPCYWNPAMPSNNGCCPAGVKGNEFGACDSYPYHVCL